MEDKKRDYKKENARQNELNKTYHFKIQKDIAKLFDDKLKENNEKAKNIFIEAIQKYLKKN